ncbi:DUF4345 family protein [Pyruvatibacter sp.]|uniref:DUF4345 family protein n=1 Tax=Pyruvatibacter sp. TaxID=1981328 RepID=UPI003266A074
MIKTRRSFQIALLVVALIPFVLGIMTLMGGAARFLPEEVVTARLDSQLRYYAIYSMLPLIMSIWIVRNLEIAGPVLLITLGATALGGAARLYSATQYGLPEPAMLGIIVFEIGVLLFLPWYRLVMRRLATPSPAAA